MQPRFSVSFSLVMASSALVACASASGSPTPAAAQEAPPPATFSAQVALGAKAYTSSCASCHGPAGEGGKMAPRVVGLAEGALPLEPPTTRKARTMRFETVADVAGFVVANMPPAHPRSLEAETYWAILAFDLHANGIDLPTKLTPEVASGLRIPR